MLSKIPKFPILLISVNLPILGGHLNSIFVKFFFLLSSPVHVCAGGKSLRGVNFTEVHLWNCQIACNGKGASAHLQLLLPGFLGEERC